VIALGIVGEIGSGKTYVSKVFKHYGYNVFNADKVVHNIYKKNKFINQKISKIFKLSSNKVKLKYLANLIIKNPSKLIKLNKIIHPEVKKKLLEFIKKNKKEKLIVLDIPLLLETNFKYFADIVVFVDAADKTLSKFRKKRRINIKLINVLKKYHLNKEKKKALSDFVIKNTNLSFLKSQTRTILNKIILHD
jgi:dephospho-CoA kinase